MSGVESKHAVCTATHAMATLAQSADSSLPAATAWSNGLAQVAMPEYKRRRIETESIVDATLKGIDRSCMLYIRVCNNDQLDDHAKDIFKKMILSVNEQHNQQPNEQSAVVMQQNTATPAKPVEVPAVAVRVVPELYRFLSALANGFADRIVENPTLMLDYADLQTRVVHYNIDGHVLKARDVWNFFEEEWFRGCCVKKTDRYPMKRIRERCVVQMNVQQAIKELKMYGKYDAAVKLP